MVSDTSLGYYALLAVLTCPASASSVLLRQKIVRKCREDIYHFLNHENGQIAIYDAVNPLAAGRRSLAKEFAKHDIEVCRHFIDILQTIQAYSVKDAVH